MWWLKARPASAIAQAGTTPVKLSQHAAPDGQYFPTEQSHAVPTIALSGATPGDAQRVPAETSQHAAPTVALTGATPGGAVTAFGDAAASVRYLPDSQPGGFTAEPAPAISSGNAGSAASTFSAAPTSAPFGTVASSLFGAAAAPYGAQRVPAELSRDADPTLAPSGATPGDAQRVLSQRAAPTVALATPGDAQCFPAELSQHAGPTVALSATTPFGAQRVPAELSHAVPAVALATPGDAQIWPAELSHVVPTVALSGATPVDAQLVLSQHATPPNVALSGLTPADAQRVQLGVVEKRAELVNHFPSYVQVSSGERTMMWHARVVWRVGPTENLGKPICSIRAADHYAAPRPENFTSGWEVWVAAEKTLRAAPSLRCVARDPDELSRDATPTVALSGPTPTDAQRYRLGIFEKRAELANRFQSYVRVSGEETMLRQY